MQYLLERMRERSTWGGLTVLAGIVGWKMAPEQLGTIADFGMALAALGLMLLQDKRG